jgi:hypothetical protein
MTKAGEEGSDVDTLDPDLRITIPMPRKITLHSDQSNNAHYFYVCCAESKHPFLIVDCASLANRTR